MCSARMTDTFIVYHALAARTHKVYDVCVSRRVLQRQDGQQG